MLDISLLASTKVELWDLTVCIAVNGEKFQSRAMTLTLVRPYPISNLSELFSYTTRYLNFMFLDQFLFELLCKSTEIQKHTHTHTHTHIHKDAQTDSDEYSIVSFCNNATITRKRFSEKPIVAFTNTNLFILDIYI